MSQHHPFEINGWFLGSSAEWEDPSDIHVDVWAEIDT